MKKIAVIGLGIMGHGIASNFLKSGYEVWVWNRTKEKADDLLAKGAKWASSPKEAASKADMVFEVTANDESSREVWLRDDGILAGAHADQALVTCATVSVNWVDELTAECQKRGQAFFDMPMTGGRMGAESGELVLLAGGDKTQLDTLGDTLEAIAKEVKYFGPAGSGMRYKLILNMLQAIHIAGFGEAMKLAKSAGLDEEVVGDALAERPGGTTTNLTWAGYQSQPDPINFSVEWIDKDLNYALGLASGASLPLLNQVLGQYNAAIASGHAQSDWTKIATL
ncbi:MAG TPA: NAD(P)-dependent oxidoreductase [Candidatus Saccharimonadales bacterium]|nr:NAD(P)-dependent oxidoreductase [Candidatus Saccharimonadales bacterium]